LALFHAALDNGGKNMFREIVENVRKTVPLIHNITNYVTVTDVANMLLACGGSPIMADDRNEVEEITSICNGLNINIGTLNERTVQSMEKAGKKANELDHIVVLDPVGAGASSFRTNTANELLKKISFTVIRGNISEIKTIAKGSGTTKGVDADVADVVTEENIEEVIGFAKELAGKTKAVIAITGAIDIVADEKNAYVVYNGHPMMSKVTGTGCMLSGVIAAFVAANRDCVLDAVVAAVAAMGLSGEIAYEKVKKENAGTSSFRTYLIDAMSNMTGEMLEGGMKIESK
jgi:hydroxyethylthiazole kinase